MPSKKELAEQAEQAGVDVPAKATKDEIADALAGSGVAPIEGSLSEAGYMEAPDGHKVRKGKK